MLVIPEIILPIKKVVGLNFIISNDIQLHVSSYSNTCKKGLPSVGRFLCEAAPPLSDDHPRNESYLGDSQIFLECAHGGRYLSQ